MNCNLIHLIFDGKDHPHFSFNRDAQVEAILELGRVKRISIDFLSDICHHPNHPSQIFWHDIPIVCIRCFGAQCDFEVLSNTQNILFQLIQPVIQLPVVRYIAILVDLMLPGWNSHQEFIMTLNRAGKLLLIPTEIPLAPLEIIKVKKTWRIRVNRLVELKNNYKLLDAIKPRLFPKNEFRIFIQ